MSEEAQSARAAITWIYDAFLALCCVIGLGLHLLVRHTMLPIAHERLATFEVELSVIQQFVMSPAAAWADGVLSIGALALAGLLMLKKQFLVARAFLALGVGVSVLGMGLVVVTTLYSY